MMPVAKRLGFVVQKPDAGPTPEHDVLTEKAIYVPNKNVPVH